MLRADAVGRTSAGTCLPESLHSFSQRTPQACLTESAVDGSRAGVSGPERIQKCSVLRCASSRLFDRGRDENQVTIRSGLEKCVLRKYHRK